MTRNEASADSPPRERGHHDQGTLVTVVHEAMRERINLATEGFISPVHTSSVAEAMEAVRDPAVRAVLLSPLALDEHRLPDVRRLVVESRGAATAVVVGNDDGFPDERLLALGSCGVNHVLDLNTREGLAYLRCMGREYWRGTARRILVRLDETLADATDGAKLFFRTLVMVAPVVTSVKSLAGELGIAPTTLASRFHRHRLPSAKRYLAEIRVLYAVACMEDPGLSFAAVARRIGYSSPQSFGRHVREQYGVTSGLFRTDYPFDRMIRRFVGELVVPYWKTFTVFDPFGS